MQKLEKVKLSNLFKKIDSEPNDYMVNKVIERLDEYEDKIGFYRAQLNGKADEKAEVIHDNVLIEKKRCEEEVLKRINKGDAEKSVATLKEILVKLEKQKKYDWIYYAILFQAGIKDLFLESDWHYPYIYPDTIGTLILCGYNFSKNEV